MLQTIIVKEIWQTKVYPKLGQLLVRGKKSKIEEIQKKKNNKNLKQKTKTKKNWNEVKVKMIKKLYA